MSYIAEFEIVTLVLQKALDAVPEMVLKTEELRISPDGSERYIFWAQGGCYEEFESVLTTDPTVADFALLTEVGDRRLYRVTYTEMGLRASTYPAATKEDIAILDVTKTHEGAQVRARVPSREALYAYRDACQERDIPFRLDRIYHEEEPTGVNTPHQSGVTEAQREALETALKRGYFAIPRETTLERIADELGISTQALSMRLRRGQRNLVHNILIAGPI